MIPSTVAVARRASPSTVPHFPNSMFVATIVPLASYVAAMWAVKRTFLDAARESRSPRFGLVDGDALSELIEGCDAKNGMDVGSSVKRIAGARSMMMIAYGQGYRSPGHGDGIVEELIGCRLVRRSTSELYREKIDGGMSTREDTSPMPSSPSTSTSRSPSSSMTAAPSQAEKTRARIWGDSPFEGRDDASEKACPGAKRGGWLPVEMVFVSPDSSLGSLRPPQGKHDAIGRPLSIPLFSVSLRAPESESAFPSRVIAHPMQPRRVVGIVKRTLLQGT